jgi:hypothetical protein
VYTYLVWGKPNVSEADDMIKWRRQAKRDIAQGPVLVHDEMKEL